MEVEKLMGKHSGKVAVVTGAGRGIGKGIAMELAREGASLAISYISDAKSATETLSAIQQFGDGIAIQADSSEVSQIENLIDQIVQHYGRIDILVSNAGIEHFSTIEESTPTDFDRVFSINTRGQFFVVQQAVQHMAPGGRIVCSSSMSATFPFARHAIYAASKAAVEAMVKNLAIDLGQRGITINAIAPGPVWTDMARQHSKEYLSGYPNLPMEDLVKSKVSMGRLGTVEDIAHLVSFLTSEEAPWITGQTIHVDGGSH